MIKYIDLFCGIGGFRLAFEKACKKNGIKNACVFSSDIDEHARKTYYENFKEYPCGDITKINAADIPAHDIIFAGFPCQAFSISGKKLGFEDTRGTLFFDVARIAKYHNPKLIVLENVKNFAGHDNGNTLKVVKKTIEDMGYLFFCEVLNAADYGSPQKRERIYIVAFRRDLRVSEYSFPGKRNRKVFLRSMLEKNVDIEKYAIKRNDIVLYDSKIESIRNKTIDSTHRIGTINKGGQGERIYHPNGFAITLSAYGGGAAAKTGAYLIDGVIRKLTTRECANIMGFPKSYKIHPLDSQAYKQFGNGVVVSVLESIFDDIISKNYLRSDLCRTARKPQKTALETKTISY